MSIKVEVSLEEQTCITCGCVFAIPFDLLERLEETHNNFYCPIGHSMYFPAKTATEIWQERTEKAKVELLKVKRGKDQIEEQLAKLKKRTNAGMCPHCHRHFANVKNHIQTKHKEVMVK